MLRSGEDASVGTRESRRGDSRIRRRGATADSRRTRLTGHRSRCQRIERLAARRIRV